MSASLTATTMKQSVSEYYQGLGYRRLYIVTNKELRKVAILYKEDNTTLTMSYAKYLYTSYYKEPVEKGYHIDHINGDKTDDRIENLQKISGHYNIVKDHSHRELLLCTCPVCGEEFLFPKRNLSTHSNPCCSRKCGGIKSHWKNNT